MQGRILLKGALLLTLLLAISVSVAEARGGRGRGGGSFGGIFGGWRKYKKPVSSGSARRTQNGSPMHTTITKSGSSGGAASADTHKHTKHHSQPHASYPQQQLSHAAGGHQNYHANGYHGAGGAAYSMPPGGTYYANSAAIPADAVYYPQPPIRSSSGTDFLFGMMTGHVLGRGLFGHRPHVTQVYQQSAQTGTATNAGSSVLVIENGTAGNSSASSSSMFDQEGDNLWPTDGEVPLAPFNGTITPPEFLESKTHPSLTPHTEAETAQSQPIPFSPPQPGGIICVPMLFNETDPNDPGKTQQVERIVCYPAPPPPPPTSAHPTAAQPGMHCVVRTVTENDPNDATKTIEVQRQECLPEARAAIVATSTAPTLVAGDIGDAGEGVEAA